ncbi:MAG: hypothetical protein ABW252_16080 [Polyangiales bacterium]
MILPPYDERDERDAHEPAFPLDARTGPAHHITRAKADLLIQRALDQAGFADASSVVANAAASTGAREHAAGNSHNTRRKRAFKTSYLVAAVLVLGATVGSASAAVLWYARVRGTAPVTANATPRGERIASSRRAPAPGRNEPAPSAVEPPAPVPEPTETAPVPTPASPPEDWLIEGNRLRANKAWQRADDAYTRALRAAPHSQTAYVAQVASASVRLEHLHDPRGALRRYRAALRAHPGGPLNEEILFGIAEAERARGDRGAEQAALHAFLRAHPGSPLAAQARARLE